MYRLTDRFTSRDGNLDPNGDPREYGISKAMMDKYGPELRDKGCATCIFVKLEGGIADKVLGFTNGGYQEEQTVAQDRWATFNMYNPGSGYNPENVNGPWSVHALGASGDVIGDIGLPYGWHVTHFGVLTWDEDGTGDGDGGEVGGGPEEPPPPEGLDKYPIYVTFDLLGRSYEGYLREVTDE